MEYAEMMFLAKMKRKAKIEFENNLWKQRFEELNGFPVEESLGKEKQNIDKGHIEEVKKCLLGEK